MTRKMEQRLMPDATWMLLLLLAALSSVSGENDRDFILCGTWRHGNDKALKLTYDLSPGCDVISVSANERSLSVEGRIAAHCQRSGEISLGQPGPGSGGQSHFCLYWEPLLDLLLVEVWGKNHTLCFPAGLQGSCCTDLSEKGRGAIAAHGIVNATIKNDIVSYKTLDSYTFYGESIDCKEEFCTEARQGSQNVNMIEETVMRSQAVGNVELPCALSSVIQMNDDFQGLNVTLNALRGLPPDSHPFVYLPPSLKSAGKKTDKVVITVVKDTSLFQNSASADVNADTIWADVVGISVENEVITNLPEPIKIRFHHPIIPKTHSRRCVSWDTRTDPSEVNWRNDGCWTFQKGQEDTECHCNHLTYFTILVQLENKPVPHLLVLTVITSLGCAASTISCVALIIFLNRKRRLKECIHVHQGLAVSLLLLYVLFFLTGTLANVGGEALCVWVGAALHYALLSSFTWMGVEVFHTFWMVYVLFSPSPKPYVWNLIGFGLPAVPVVILLAVGNIYGVRDVFPANDIDNPFKMCWMKRSEQAFLAHYCTNVSMLALLVASGLVMLYLIYRQVRDRDEWRSQSSRTFQGIWGLSVLFGSTWSLSFLNFGVLSNYVLILTCILNSLQGFSLLLRFFLLDRMRRKESGSAQRSSISGSTRQHMLQAHDNNSYRELDSNTNGTKKHMAA